ncbi:hypothetical protein [Szabonella alba]|uniref:Phytol kinase n=1 Tax=Szabonella alba TaxID=2804194 RepID=A0A8K0VB69_9RHOB|nr:hypothetical protein [Szabonella alba]MBL4918476.1 hypothetical protein [Szabonella alba]
MSIALQVALAAGSVAVLTGMIALVRLIARHAALAPEVQRKLVHVATGLYALCLPWLFPDRWPVYLLIGGALAVMVALRIPQISGTMGQALHGVERRSYGDFLLALAVGLCFFLADGVALFYVLPIAVLTLADAAAALAGTAYGTRRFRVEEGEKSIEGTVVFFTVTLLIALICLMFLSDLPPASILALALMTAAFGALVEAQSWRGFDNLFLPLGLFVFLSVHSQSGPGELLGLLVAFWSAILGFRLLGPQVGLTAHAARVYVVAVFMILAVVEVQNAVLPVLALLAHVWARRRNPDSDRYGDLDVVAALALFSFGWLALGNATGWNAVQFYGLTAMGLVMGLATLAMIPDRKVVWLPLVAALLFGLREVVTRLNPPATHWAEPLWPLALLCLALPGLAGIIRPDLFRQDRVLKLTFLSIILPLGHYLFALAGTEGGLALSGAIP